MRHNKRTSLSMLFVLTLVASSACSVPFDALTAAADITGRPASVVVSGIAAMTVGQTSKLNVVVSGADGHPLPDASLAWENSAPTVATIIADGTVTALSAGNVTFTAASGSAKSTAWTITVTAPAGTPAPPAPPTPPSSGTASPAQLPTASVETAMPTTAGTVISVAAGGDLQAAINQAVPGDVIELAAGATYAGAFTLPNKGASTAWIVIRPASGTSLPGEGSRMTPALAQTARLPIIRSVDAGNAIQTDLGAHHYRIIGVEITLGTSITQSYGLVGFGMDKIQGQTTIASTAHHLILDRVYVHGTATASLRRCVAFNSATTAVIDSWLSDCHDDSADAQAIGGWNGPGPFLIRNNELQGSTENIMFGGSDAAAVELSPADITIQRNHIFKPAAWIGSPWHIKNLFELKNAQRVLVEENVMEGSWPRDWDGTAVAMKSANQGCGPVPAGTLDVTFRRNLIRNIGSGINLDAGSSCGGPIWPMSRVLIQDNMIVGINSVTYNGIGNGFFTGGALTDVTIDHNTVTWARGGLSVNMDNYDHPTIRFALTNNLFATIGGNGVQGQSTGYPGPSITHFMPDGRVAGNVFALGTPFTQGYYGTYPAGNTVLINDDASFAPLGFTNSSAGDFSLLLTSPAKVAATDGGSAGANVAAVMAAAAVALRGTP